MDRKEPFPSPGSADSDRSWKRKLQLLDEDDFEGSNTELKTSALWQDSPKRMMCCLNCSSKKRLSTRPKQFCSPQCMRKWELKHPPKKKSELDIHMAGGSKRATRSNSQTTICSVSSATHTFKDVQQLPAIMKNLYIDMATPGSTLHHPVDPEEELKSWVATPTVTTQTASSTAKKKNGSHRRGTCKSNIEPLLKKRRTKPTQKTKMKVYRRRKRCGKCAACCRKDCGKCTMCRDKKKFGGKSILRKPCIKRVCKHLKYDEQGSSASKSEPNDSIGNEAEREAPQVSQEKEAVESDQTVTVGSSDCSSGSAPDSESVSLVVKLPLTVLKNRERQGKPQEQEENIRLKGQVRQLRQKMKALQRRHHRQLKRLQLKREKNKAKEMKNKWKKNLLCLLAQL